MHWNPCHLLQLWYVYDNKQEHFRRAPTMIQIASYMPQLAPLPIPMAEHLLKQRRKLLKKTARTSSQDELEKGALSLLEENVQEKRQAVYVLMDPLVQTEKVSRELSLSTTLIMQVLRAHTPD